VIGVTPAPTSPESDTGFDTESDTESDTIAALFGGEPPPDDPTTERILDSALTQFATFGLRRTSVDDVAKQAGVTRVTVYRRFPNRDQLIGATLYREYQRFLAVLDPVVRVVPSMEERIVEGFLVALRHVQSHPLLGGLLRSEPELVLPALTVDGGPALVAMRDYLTRGFARFQREAGIAAADPAPAAEIMVRIVMSFLLNPTSCVELADDEAARAFARRYLAPMFRA
jgi:AcrR family transcriptional regulator